MGEEGCEGQGEVETALTSSGEEFWVLAVACAAIVLGQEGGLGGQGLDGPHAANAIWHVQRQEGLGGGLAAEEGGAQEEV
jgi:hypothetical protein